MTDLQKFQRAARVLLARLLMVHGEDAPDPARLLMVHGEDTPKARRPRTRRSPLHVARQPDESDARSMDRATLLPTVNNAETFRRVTHRDFGETRLNKLVKELSAQCGTVSRGDMGRRESLLTAQAHRLDALFNDLTRLAYRNWSNLAAAERLLRLAFKAQSQGRATVETLGNLRNAPMVIARQAGIAHGPQQVNSGEPGNRLRSGNGDRGSDPPGRRRQQARLGCRVTH